MKKIFSWWYDAYSFDFIEDKTYPDKDKVTCVFGLVKSWDKIWLTKNHRGWEFPGGHIEKWESLETSLKRKIQEEIGIDLLKYSYIGYKKITSNAPQKNRAWWYYPFPNSYILFYICEWPKERVYNLCPETFDVKLCSYEEARELINSEYTQRILDYLYN